MEQTKTYEFTDEEIHVLTEALGMYAAYMKHVTMPMLVGDESDAGKLSSEAATAEQMFTQFFDQDNDHDWEEERKMFAEINGRPMDLSDYSQFDWHEYQEGDQ